MNNVRASFKFGTTLSIPEFNREETLGFLFKLRFVQANFDYKVIIFSFYKIKN